MTLNHAWSLTCQEAGERSVGIVCEMKSSMSPNMTSAKSFSFRIFPGGSDSTESACKAGDPDLIPGLGRSPGEGNGNPLQYCCQENSTDRGAWRAIVHGVTKSWTWLSDFHFCARYCYWKGGTQFLAAQKPRNRSASGKESLFYFRCQHLAGGGQACVRRQTPPQPESLYTRPGATCRNNTVISDSHLQSGFFEASSRNCGSFCCGWSLVTRQLSPSTWCFGVYKTAHGTWLRIPSMVLERGLKVLDYA